MTNQIPAFTYFIKSENDDALIDVTSLVRELLANTDRLGYFGQEVNAVSAIAASSNGDFNSGREVLLVMNPFWNSGLVAERVQPIIAHLESAMDGRDETKIEWIHNGERLESISFPIEAFRTPFGTFIFNNFQVAVDGTKLVLLSEFAPLL